MSQDESNIFYSSLRGRPLERNVDSKPQPFTIQVIANKE
jgi:hypothetical protein